MAQAERSQAQALLLVPARVIAQPESEVHEQARDRQIAKGYTSLNISSVNQRQSCRPSDAVPTQHRHWGLASLSQSWTELPRDHQRGSAPV